jgi:ATPase subunit of ABC transporter with duplicated ATPase domains
MSSMSTRVAVAARPPSSSSFAFCLHEVQCSFADGSSLWERPLSLTIGHERLGIVGRNGVGKSLLAALLAGRRQPSRGTVERAGRVHWVAPPVLPDDRRSVADTMGLGAEWAAVARLAAGQATPDDVLLAEGHWDLPARVTAALAHAGLAGLHPDDPVSALSGGERMRVALAGAMATDAESVILDEPSNHLDREGCEALMRWLRAVTRTVVLVSHDRQLLRAVDRIAELSPQGLALYGGDYALYTAQRDAESGAAEAALAHARVERDAALAKLRREHDRRQRRQAHTWRDAHNLNLPRIVLGALQQRAEHTRARNARRETESRLAVDAAVRAAAERVEQLPPLALALPSSRVPAAKPVLRLEGLRLPHVDGPALDAALAGPVRVALSGPNGCGKTTLLRVIGGTLSARAGSAIARVGLAALDQDGGEALPLQMSLLEWLQALDSALSHSALRTRLAQLRLDADRIARPMRNLSAGERVKAALAGALWRAEPARLLLLDEPTNHLDLDSTLVLQRALQGFGGAMLVASHDTEFIAALRPTHRWSWQAGRLSMDVCLPASADTPRGPPAG